MSEFFSPRTGRRVADTQQAAFHALTVQDISESQRKILALFKSPGAVLTRYDIAEILGLPVGSVCGRVRELIDAGRLIVVGKLKVQRNGRSVSLQLLGLQVSD
ncbi:hypothetical protein [Burkholderia cenocepacia]|uniref:Winged helix-turn-helix transcriptional regulator n=1 Tax=Burkholderia cenocepacia TaxID=95486 RepID=A0A6B2MCL3_9BURK|nr:hypothetical protein [Burkholderia cenocepacia]NDV73515.1 hypothetical protein [Burkholderia cenocepacia]